MQIFFEIPNGSPLLEKDLESSSNDANLNISELDSDNPCGH